MLGLAAAPAQAGFTSLYVFGDSLSDAAGGSAAPLAPIEGGLPIPAPYDNGRLSNGAVAAEYLAGMLGLNAANTYQFAIAGARSGANGTFPGTGVASQIAAFGASGLASTIDPAGSLFMVWSGANDLRDLITSNGGPAQLAAIITQISTNVSTLYGLGARNFLLPNVPNIGRTPEALLADQQFPGAAAAASAVTAGFNGALFAALGALEATLPGADFDFADIFSAGNALLDNPASLGITNTSNGCLVPVANLPAPSACPVSFYVDNIHPTTQVHQAIASVLMAAVPEPGTMLLTGTAVLALIGASARRRQARS